MTIGKLYGPPDNFRVLKVQLVAEINGVELETTPEFKLFADNQKPEFLDKFPLGQSPGFAQADGSTLTQSAVIAFHVAQSNPNMTLLGDSNIDIAKIWQFILFTETSVIPHAMDIVLRKFDYAPKNEAADEHDRKALERSLAYLDKEIASKNYLVGDRLTLADVNTYANLIYPFKFVLNAGDRVKYPNVIRYFEGLSKLKEFEKIMGPVVYAE